MICTIFAIPLLTLLFLLGLAFEELREEKREKRFQKKKREF